MARLFIGIDSGTQSTKAVLVDGDSGAVLARGSAAHTLLPSATPGCREQDPADWVTALDSTIHQALGATAVNTQDVRGIGISGQQHGFVPLDGQGRVIRAAKLWCDTTTAAQCATMTARLGGRQRTIELLGNPVDVLLRGLNRCRSLGRSRIDGSSGVADGGHDPRGYHGRPRLRKGPTAFEPRRSLGRRSWELW